jgi:methionyl-tRNA synthetase
MENITISDFEKVDLRIAVVKAVHPHPKSNKMIVLVLDAGDKEVQVLAGLKQHYTENDLLGKRIVYVANLEPKVIGGLESNGMVLAAEDGEHRPLMLTTFEGEMKPGAKVK